MKAGTETFVRQVVMGDHEMVCVQASLLVEELMAAGYLLSSVDFTGGKGLREASCHVGMPARGCA